MIFLKLSKYEGLEHERIRTYKTELIKLIEKFYRKA